VTLVVVNHNTQATTELALREIRRRTRYPAYQIWVIDNASTDGSADALPALAREIGATLIASTEPHPHSYWLDHAMAHVDSPYWVAVDSDTLVIRPDWLWRMVRAMEQDQSLFLLNAEAVPPEIVQDPIEGRWLEGGERVSSWLFMVRTALRERLGESFAFARRGVNPATGREQVFDTGGRLLQAMRQRGIRYGAMPPAFRLSYYHIGAMSCLPGGRPASAWQLFKEDQVRDVESRLVRARRAMAAPLAAPV
jgi:glycosyltransferase involved in cell wall biosynthesis